MRLCSIAIALLALLFVGCRQDSEAKQLIVVLPHLDECLSSITNGVSGTEFKDGLEKLINEISTLTNVHSRCCVAGKLAHSILGVDLELKGKDYQSHGDKIERYVQYSGACSKIVKESLGDEAWLDFFVQSGAKIKQACFSVPWGAREPDESIESYRLRLSVALNLYNTYESQVNLWRFYAGTGNKALLDTALRKRFVDSTRHLFDYPSRKTLLAIPRNLRCE